MKKTYIIPEILIVDLFMHGNILTGSTFTKDLSDAETADPSWKAEVKERKSIWDKEW